MWPVELGAQEILVAARRRLHLVGAVQDSLGDHREGDPFAARILHLRGHVGEVRERAEVGGQTLRRGQRLWPPENWYMSICGDAASARIREKAAADCSGTCVDLQPNAASNVSNTIFCSTSCVGPPKPWETS